jgi:hypothetical protein
MHHHERPDRTKLIRSLLWALVLSASVFAFAVVMAYRSVN